MPRTPVVPVKTLGEIDHEYLRARAERGRQWRTLSSEYTLDSTAFESQREETIKKSVWASRASGAFFYLILLIVVGTLFFSYGDNNAPRSFFGYAMMRVLSPSMQDVLPKDSLIITREVDPAALQVGDDISFLKNASTTLTHRIIAIDENYADSGKRGFQTQGTMNTYPDKDVVPAHNLVGKVIFNNLFLGIALGFIRQYTLWIVFFAALVAGLAMSLRVAFSKDETSGYERSKGGPEKGLGKKEGGRALSP
jgi:signal peptidase